MNLRLVKLILCFVLSISLILPSTILVFAEGNSLQDADIKVLTDYFKQKINERKANIDAFVKILHDRTVKTVSITDVRFNAQKNAVPVKLTLTLNTGSTLNVTYDYELTMAEGDFQFGLLCAQEDNSGKLVRQGLWFPNSNAPSFSRPVTSQDVKDILHFIKTGEIPAKHEKPRETDEQETVTIPPKPNLSDMPQVTSQPTAPDKPIEMVSDKEMIENYIKQTLQEDSDGRFKKILFKLYGGLIIRNVKINDCDLSLPILSAFGNKATVNVTFSRLFLSYNRTFVFRVRVSSDYSELGLKLSSAENVKNIPNIEYWSPKADAPVESVSLSLLNIKIFVNKFFNRYYFTGPDEPEPTTPDNPIVTLPDEPIVTLPDEPIVNVTNRKMIENYIKQTLQADSDGRFKKILSNLYGGLGIIRNVKINDCNLSLPILSAFGNKVTVNVTYTRLLFSYNCTLVFHARVSLDYSQLGLKLSSAENVKNIPNIEYWSPKADKPAISVPLSLLNVENFVNKFFNNGNGNANEFVYKVLNRNFPEIVNKYIGENAKEETQCVLHTDSNTYIVLTMGSKPTSGYSIKINDVVLGNDGITVFAKYIAPPEDGYVTQVPTCPVSVIELNRVYKETVKYNIDKLDAKFLYKVMSGDFPEIVNKYIGENAKEETQCVLHTDGNTYIVLTMGSKPTGGYSITIKDVVLGNAGITVFAKYIAPPEDEYVTQVITYPVSVIVLNRVYKETVSYDIEKFDVKPDKLSYTVIKDNFPEFITKIFNVNQHQEFQMETNDDTNTYIVVSLGDAYPGHHIQVKDVKLQGNKMLASIRYVIDPEIPPRPPLDDAPEYVPPARQVAIKLNKLYNLRVEYDIERPIIEQPSGFSYQVLQGNLPKIVEDYLETGKYFDDQQVLHDDDKTYIVLTMGVQRTGGHYISVQNVTLRNGNIYVDAAYHHPPIGSIQTQAITFPVTVIALNKVYTEPVEYRFMHQK